MKKLFIAEKPSVANEFALALDINKAKGNGFIESDKYVFTWCVGHLVTMSYPEVYDERYKKWNLTDLPFLPEKFKYEVIKSVKKQFDIVESLLKRADIDTIYVCTDSGREGEYIYRLVDDMVKVDNKMKLRVWIDSQTKDEILRGIKEAKDLSAYDNLSSSAYLRAKEDYLMGINFSRLLSLKYASTISNLLGKDFVSLSVGRVMTCVLGMVVNREREIREFVKTPFYRLILNVKHKDFKNIDIYKDNDNNFIDAEFKAVESSRFFASPKLYKDTGFKEKKDAQNFSKDLEKYLKSNQVILFKKEAKKEIKSPPLLYNLAELQNECAKIFKISPDETLKIVQDLYEAKLLTYPRTDARVLSSAVAKEIVKNIKGLNDIAEFREVVEYIINKEKYKSLIKTKYVNDKLITDHYAIIPTGAAILALSKFSKLHKDIYFLVAKRFLSIFLPNAEYKKYSLDFEVDKEHFISNFKVLENIGYLHLYKDKKDKEYSKEFIEFLAKLRKNEKFEFGEFLIKEGETSAPKRYNSGSIILAMENAGQLIEDEDLRATIKGSGIGTSATRAEILKKLFDKSYLSLNKKTQIISPSLFGELVYEAVFLSIKQLLNPKLSASWEKGLNYVADGSIETQEYMFKLEDFIKKRTSAVKNINNAYLLRDIYEKLKPYYIKSKVYKKES